MHCCCPGSLREISRNRAESEQSDGRLFILAKYFAAGPGPRADQHDLLRHRSGRGWRVCLEKADAAQGVSNGLEGELISCVEWSPLDGPWRASARRGRRHGQRCSSRRTCKQENKEIERRSSARKSVLKVSFFCHLCRATVSRTVLRGDGRREVKGMCQRRS